MAKEDPFKDKFNEVDYDNLTKEQRENLIIRLQNERTRDKLRLKELKLGIYSSTQKRIKSAEAVLAKLGISLKEEEDPEE